jgi:hypothetical protein
MCSGFWWGNLREREHGGDPDLDGRIIKRRMDGPRRRWENSNEMEGGKRCPKVSGGKS